jgi:hypothetical protein
MSGRRNAAAGMLVEKQTTQSRGLAGWSVEDTVTALPVLRRLSQSSLIFVECLKYHFNFSKIFIMCYNWQKNTCQIFYQQIIYCRVFFWTLKEKHSVN